MPLPLTVSCFSKIQIGFTFLVLAHLGSPGKGPLNGCVCVCVCVCCSMHQYECVALGKGISLQRGRFCARSLAIYIPSRDPAKTGHRECSSSGLCAAAPVVASSSLEEVRRRLGYSICVLIHSCKMSKESETTGLSDGWKWWLVGNKLVRETKRY